MLALSCVVVLVAAGRVCTGQASAEAERAWSVADPVVAAMNRGVALMAQYDYAEAVEAFEEAVRLEPKSLEARLNLAIALFNRAGRSDIEAAGKLLDELIGEAPDNPRALYVRGIVHMQAGQDAQAQACFEKVVKLAPHESHAWYMLARSKEHQGQPCREELKRALEENPALVSAYYQLMRIALQEDKQEEADRYQEQFARLRESPLADMVVMPQYQAMGPLALAQPPSAAPRSSLTGGELASGPVRTLIRGTATLAFAGVPSAEETTPAGRIVSRFGSGMAMADVNGDGHVDLVTTAGLRDGAPSGSKPLPLGPAGGVDSAGSAFTAGPRDGAPARDGAPSGNAGPNRRGLALLLGQADRTFADATERSGLGAVRGAVSCAFGDFDNDGKVDLFVCREGPNHLFKGRGDGTFEDVTGATKTAGPDIVSVSAVFIDADHDGDLDIYVCNAASLDGSTGLAAGGTKPAANQLLNNNADGTFTDIATPAGVACAEHRSVMLAPADIDGDRDTDLVVFHEDGPARLFLNDRLGKYHEGKIGDAPIQAGFGGVLQDFNGDGRVDLLAALGPDTSGRLYLSDGTGGLKASTQFDGVCKALTTWGNVHATRVADVDLDGDLDIAVFGGASPHPFAPPDASAQETRQHSRREGMGHPGHVLLNDGWGRFVLKTDVWPLPTDDTVVGIELADMTGDGVPDVVVTIASPHPLAPRRASTQDTAHSARGQGMGHPAATEPPTLPLLSDHRDPTHPLARMDGAPGESGELRVVTTTLTPPANWLAVVPTGDRGDDKRTRSPASGFGTRMEVRAGLHSQVIVHTGLSGGLCQSQTPVIVGLDGAAKADYLALVWPDGVTQTEIALAAGPHRIVETERKISSCPVLFSWNGERFEFVTDFAGVGGLGYFVQPGEYAPPQVLEHVKIEPRQLAPRNGLYELRICEPMEEVGYVDRIELLAVDHPRERPVYPDERLSVTGPAPTHRLLSPDRPIFPVRAVGPDGVDCTDRLARVDRVYAYQPPLDRRFFGFCRPHTLVLDFDELPPLGLARNANSGDDASTARPRDGAPTRGVWLFINGWIEYPYSQTTYAAGQAGVGWSPLKIERQTDEGGWETIVPDAGAPGGMGRMFTVELTGKLPAGRCKLRMTTNLEVYYDQIFLAADRGTQEITIQTVPMKQAVLRRLGFPLEYSPDGRLPLIYTYDIIDGSSAFKMLRGAYTRYGSVGPLLKDFDDRYVILGSGDELAVSFDATGLPSVDEGRSRSFILVSHAYCKDMDLYTAEPDTVDPLPFRHMSAYPYPLTERYPDSDECRSYQNEFNTRMVN